MAKTYQVEKSEKLSTNWDCRYVVLNVNNGKIMEEWQSCGYQSANDAYMAYTNKNQTPKQKKKRKKEYGIIREWVKTNKDAFRDIQDSILYAWFQYQTLGEDIPREDELSIFEHELAKHELTLPEGITLNKALKLYAGILSDINKEYK